MCLEKKEKKNIMETEREKERVVFFGVLDEFLLSFFGGGRAYVSSVQNDNC